MTTTAPTVPRRWNVEVDGICWLPRMIDKVHMRAAGRLGAYLLGHSPVDRALLTRLGVSTEEFAAIAAREPSDERVLAALRARGFDEERVRRWSESFPTRYRQFIYLWDLDEGYRKPNPFEATLRTVFQTVEKPLMDAYRRMVTPP